MPKLKTATRSKPLETRVADCLRDGLEQAGFHVDAVETQPLKGTKLFRVTLVARGFDKLWVSERQDLVWRIIGASFSRADQMRISMIVTLAPPEVTAA